MVRWAVVLGSAVVVAACSSRMKTPPELLISLSPNKISDATPVVVKVSALDANGKNGTGSVRVTSVRGSLVDGVDVPLDAYGTARAELVCDPAQDPACLSTVRVVAEWTSDGEAVIAEAKLNLGGSAGPTSGAGVNPSGSGGSGFSSTRVLLLGTLSEGSCGRDALADPRTPTDVAVSFPCYIDEYSAKRVNGTMYYRKSFSPGIHVFKQDPWDSQGGAALYPSPDKVPDDVLYPECGSVRFWLSRNGRILHTCPDKPGSFLYINGVPTTIDASRIDQVLAFGDDDAILTSQSVVAADGTMHSTGRYFLSSNPTLAIAGGFYATDNAGNACSLVKIGLDGSTADAGSYPVPCGGALDSAGTLTSFGRDNGDDTVVETPRDGVPTTIYSEANATVEDYSLVPPRVYVKIHISDLVGAN